MLNPADWPWWAWLLLVGALLLCFILALDEPIMSDQEKRLTERAEKLRRRMIEALSCLSYDKPDQAKDILERTIREDF